MRPLSGKIANIAPSATMSIAAQAKALQAKGIDVISLSLGEPDFDTPAHITEAAIAALRSGKTHYAPGRGIPELLSAIAEKTTRENNSPCTSDQVIVTCGAKSAIHQSCEAVLNAGDEAIILDPSWVSYEPCVQIAGGKPVHVPLSDKNFQPDERLAEAITAKTRMIIVNSPSNPSGSVLERDSLKMIADLCIDHDLIAVSDEIYEKLIYSKVHHSLGAFADMSERTITVNGFSKAYAMTGWRLGYAVAPADILKQMDTFQQHTTSQATTFAMYGAVAALTGSQDCVHEMRDEFRRRRDNVLLGLSDIGLETCPADGAFYTFINVQGDDMLVTSEWLEKGRVAVTPGFAFNAPGWVRMSYAASQEQLDTAIERISALYT
ncbi:MAG: pyridoxal phosphate-dependent aminotransferase [Methanomicrobiales archaeon]|jgi:aspartate aminotransferase|nr:pyridoxal phosphate-dependent aminotransferase [Methanomicrobiales archaeon]